MPMSTEKATNVSQESDGKYEQFLRSLRLIWVGLKSCSSSLDRDALYRLSSEKKKPIRTFEGTYKVNQVGTGYFEASGLFLVTVRESPEADPVVSVTCEFEAHLHAAKPLHRPFIERFASSEFHLILVPYARQFVSATTAQMNIPPLFIPLSTVSSPGENAAGSKRITRDQTHAKAR
jgi:hypothetical protein